MKRKAIIWIAAIGVAAGGWAAQRAWGAYDALREQAKTDARHWVHRYALELREIDRALAEALATGSPKRRSGFLRQARDAVHRLPVYAPQVAPSFNGLSMTGLYGSDARNYLEYLASRAEPDLEPSQLDGIRAMREQASAVRERLQALERRIGETKAASLRRDEGIAELVRQAETAGAASRAPWLEDKAFNDYLYALHPYPAAYSRPWFEGEAALTGAELARKANAFMGELWADPAFERFVGGDGSGGGEIPAYVTFVARSAKGDALSPYQADVTVVGGHVMKVTYVGDPSVGGAVIEADPPDEAGLKKAAERWIERWGETRLVFKGMEEKEGYVRLVYVPERDGGLILQQAVELWLDDADGKLLQFDATRYLEFSKYDLAPAKLSPEEAVAKLGPGAQAAGSPRLQAMREKLVYAIPIRGIERVSQVYINAVTGAEEGIEYIRDGT